MPLTFTQLTQTGLILFGRTKVNNCIQCDGQQNVDNFQKSANENIVKSSVLMAKCEET